MTGKKRLRLRTEGSKIRVTGRNVIRVSECIALELPVYMGIATLTHDTIYFVV